MSGAVLVAIAAAVGNLLQGWDNATIAESILLSCGLVTRELRWLILMLGVWIEWISFVGLLG